MTNDPQAVLPEALIRYLADRDAQRTRDVETTLTAMTERERRLVREAAVMGYVRGRMHPAEADHPKDSAVLHEVIAACLATSDLYPVISGIRPCRECSHPEFNHRDSDDPDVPGACLQCETDWARHDYRMTPDGERS